MPMKDRQKLYALQKAHRQRNRQKVIEYLETHSCEWCGEADPRCLEFDHIDPKDKHATIARMMSGHPSWERILSEIEKCRVLCANCHRKRSHDQCKGWGSLRDNTNASVTALASNELKQ